tara:strand:+ start:1251 stop:1982 length:732 start_codon:yes stop_codon:yes gene_type:complete
MPIATFVDTAENCIYGYQIAHLRDSEGYSRSYYDQEGDDGTLKDFFVTVPASDGDIYFMAESYYQDLVPEECTSGTYLGNSLTAPVADVTVYQDGSTVSSTYKVYSDQFNYPLLVTTYSAGVVFKFAVQYTWFGSVAPDYTITVYSKQNLEVKNANGGTNVVNYDGTEPSGYTGSSFKGMKGWIPVIQVPTLYANLVDVWYIAWEDGWFWAFWNWQWLCSFGGAAAVCWNPFAWFGTGKEGEE